jgi:phosphatidylserine decarboxylase
MSDRLAVLPQYLLPKQLLTRFAGVVAGFEGGALTHALIRWFVKRYQVNMAEAEESDLTRFPTFNAFFTRALKPGVRPLAGADLVCPVDGAVSQSGPIVGDRIFQAKGHDYTAQALLGGDGELAQQFDDGRFATIYLSPRDYHRIHMPCDGRLTRMIHVPGDLFSVNPTTARGVPGLFARNERVVCLFDTPHGAMALVLVGATVVGSMATVWHGVVNPPRPGRVREWRYEQTPVALRKGDEMGRFLLGSTVVLLFQREAGVQWQSDWAPAHPVQLGEAMASTAA